MLTATSYTIVSSPSPGTTLGVQLATLYTTVALDRQVIDVLYRITSITRLKLAMVAFLYQNNNNILFLFHESNIGVACQPVPSQKLWLFSVGLAVGCFSYS